jgi:hypothetical protein
LPRRWFADFEYFSQNGWVTWILDVGIDGIFDVIKEGFGAGTTIGLPERFSF